MKNYSLWLDNIELNKCQRLEQEMEVDVLIVGGGITGLSTLYQLRNSNLKTILVERNICGHGVTARSTAKITYLQEQEYINIRKDYGMKAAQNYLQSQREAVNLLTNIINIERIDCDLKRSYSYLFTNKKENVQTLEEEYTFLKKNGVSVAKTKVVPFEEPVKEALYVSDTYVFHPLKYLNHLKEMLKDSIYEESHVTEIKKEQDTYICLVNNYRVKAKYVVIATHYPYFLLPFMLPMKSYIETSYVGAKKVNQFEDFNAINIDKPTISIRYHQDQKQNYFLYLYGSYKSCDIKNIKINFKDLENKIDLNYVWSNKDIITNDYMPYIGSVHHSDLTFLIACGYNTWGMTNGTLAGKILADIILQKENPYIPLFDPKRKFKFTKLLKFPIDLGASLKAFLKSTKNNVNNTKVIYTKRNGKSVAIYIDEKNQEHVVLNRCPHMKCGLVFNEQEKTWDCLCHGSRFDLDGNLMEGPSNMDIKFKY